MSGPPRSLDSSVTAAVIFPPTLSPATARRSASRPYSRPALGGPLHHRIALLEGRRVCGLGGETILGEHDGGPGSDREFTHQSVMRVRAAEHPPGTVDVHDDRQRRRSMLWPQDAQSNLFARTICNREILDLDRQSAHQARLRLIEYDTSLFGTKCEQQGWLRRSLARMLEPQVLAGSCWSYVSLLATRDKDVVSFAKRHPHHV